MSEELDKILEQPGTSMLQALFAIDKERREAVERAEAVEAVAAQYKRANDALRAQWASVPWESIGHCLSVAIYGAPLQRETAQAALDWWHAHAENEAAK